MNCVSLSGRQLQLHDTVFLMRQLRFGNGSPFIILHAVLALFLDIEFTF